MTVIIFALIMMQSKNANGYETNTWNETGSSGHALLSREGVQASGTPIQRRIVPDKRPKGGSARSGISRQNASTKSTTDTRDRAIPWRAVRNETDPSQPPLAASLGEEGEATSNGKTIHPLPPSGYSHLSQGESQLQNTALA